MQMHITIKLLTYWMYINRYKTIKISSEKNLVLFIQAGYVFQKKNFSLLFYFLAPKRLTSSTLIFCSCSVYYFERSRRKRARDAGQLDSVSRAAGAGDRISEFSLPGAHRGLTGSGISSVLRTRHRTCCPAGDTASQTRTKGEDRDRGGGGQLALLSGTQMNTQQSAEDTSLETAAAATPR